MMAKKRILAAAVAVFFLALATVPADAGRVPKFKFKGHNAADLNNIGNRIDWSGTQKNWDYSGSVLDRSQQFGDAASSWHEAYERQERERNRFCKKIPIETGSPRCLKQFLDRKSLISIESIEQMRIYARPPRARVESMIQDKKQP